MMKLDARSLALGTLVGVFALGSQGCAPAAETATDDEVDQGAIKAGGRWVSPFEPGAYDSDDGMVTITNWFDRQTISSTVAQRSTPLNLCLGTTADFTDGKASIQAPECALTLKPGDTKDVIAVAGTLNSTGRSTPYADTFRRRPKDALVGKYTDGKVVLTVEASSEAAVTYSMTMGGKLVANHEIAKAELFDAATSTVIGPSGFEMNKFAGKTSGCSIQLHISRSAKRYGISVNKWVGSVTNLNECPEYIGIMQGQ